MHHKLISIQIHRKLMMLEPFTNIAVFTNIYLAHLLIKATVQTDRNANDILMSI